VSSHRIACIVLFGAVFAGAIAAAPPPKAVVTIALPSDEHFTFKAGPGAEATQRYCLTCHSSAYVSTQPPLTKAQWTAEVTKMRKAYGAPIPDDAASTIVDYLTATYGNI